MRIALAGSGVLAARMANTLAASKHEVVALVQNGRKKGGIRRSIARATAWLYPREVSTVSFALRRKVPIVWIDKMTEEELAPLRRIHPDLLLVCGFGIILKKPLLTLPRIGCVNTHSSLLPKHRGPDPFTAVVLANERESGVTFHVMDEGIDTGDIIAQFPFPVTPKDTSLVVYKNACRIAADHVVPLMDRIEAEGLNGTPQNQSEGTYDKKTTDGALRVVWEKPSEDIKRLTLAFSFPNPPWFLCRGTKIRLIRVAVKDTPSDALPGTILATCPRLTVATGRGVVEILSAYRTRPVPCFWPTRWSRLTVGERLR